jgi:hypothetical protein
MASKVSIVNAALIKLGVGTISALTDDAPQARIANLTFDDIRDDLLRDHLWSWATKRVSLAASATSPDWEFANAFTLPSDYLRLVAVNNPSKYAYRIESTSDGRVIVTDLPAPLEVSYVARITDVSQMDPKFREAFSARLAMEWAEPLTAVSKLAEDMARLYDMKLRAAKAVESQEDSISTFDVSSWTNSRY